MTDKSDKDGPLMFRYPNSRDNAMWHISPFSNCPHWGKVYPATCRKYYLPTHLTS